MSIDKYIYNLGYGLNDFFPIYSAEDKTRNIEFLVRYILNRLRRAFKYKNLPEGIRERDLELMTLQGHVFIKPFKDGYSAFRGHLAPPLDEYYFPKNYIITNPWAKVDGTFKIGEDGILIKNDSTLTGVIPLITKYATMLCENELTMKVVDVLARSALVFGVEDKNKNTSAEEYLKDLEKGKLGVITLDNFRNEDGVKVQPGATSSATILTNLVEFEQYLKASLWNELGLNANWNAKRETIGNSESLLNSDTLRPLIDDMMECRKEGWEEFNKLYNERVEVEFNSSWEDNEKELKAVQEELDNRDKEMATEEEVKENEENVE